MAAVVLVLGQGATFVLLAVTCAILGRLLTVTVVFSDRWERGAITSILGLGASAHILNILGLLGMLNRRTVLALLVVTLAVGIGVLVHRGMLHDQPTVRTDAPKFMATIASRRGLFILGTVLGPGVFVLLLVLASYPPVAFDETLYHLPMARAFVRTGALPFLPQLRVPVFPPLTELLFSAMLLFFDNRATHLVSLLATILTTLLLVGWGKKQSSWRCGVLAGALYLGNPMVIQLSSTAYVDPTLALFVTAALYSVASYREDRSRTWLVLAALFSATAAGTKYLGLFFVPAAFVLLMLSPSEGERAPRLWVSGLFWMVGAATLLPVYARIVYFTGNPLFPFLPTVFGSTLWDPAPSQYSTIAARLVGTLTLPWKAVFDPAAVGRQAPLSPFLLLFSPLLLIGLARRSTLRALLLMCAVFVFAVPPDARYLIAVLPIVCLALASALEQVFRWAALKAHFKLRPRMVVWIFCGILLLPGWFYAGRAIFKRGVPPVGDAQRDVFLSRQLPVYRAIAVLNQSFGARFSVYAVHAENLVYWAQGTLLGDWTGPASFARVLPLANNPIGLHCTLRELGAGYLLVTKGHDDFPLPTASPEFLTRFRRIYEDDASDLFVLSPTDPRCH